MSELGDIHEKINSVAIDVAKLRTSFEDLKPAIATKSDLSLRIKTHETDCPHEPKIPRKIVAAIGGAIVAITALATALASNL